MPLSLNKGNLHKLPKKEDRFNNVYDSDGVPVPFCDIEYLEDTQYFYEYALPDVFSLGDGKTLSDYEGNEYVTEGGDKLNNDSSHIVHADIL